MFVLRGTELAHLQYRNIVKGTDELSYIKIFMGKKENFKQIYLKENHRGVIDKY
jgi:hypothetical protein